MVKGELVFIYLIFFTFEGIQQIGTSDQKSTTEYLLICNHYYFLLLYKDQVEEFKWTEWHTTLAFFKEAKQKVMKDKMQKCNAQNSSVNIAATFLSCGQILLSKVSVPIYFI